jgi:hypothetical protein
MLAPASFYELWLQVFGVGVAELTQISDEFVKRVSDILFEIHERHKNAEFLVLKFKFFK